MKIVFQNYPSFFECTLIDINCDDDFIPEMQTFINEFGRIELLNFLREKQISFIIHTIHYFYYDRKLIKNNNLKFN